MNTGAGREGDSGFGTTVWDEVRGIHVFSDERYLDEAVAADIYSSAGLPHDEIWCLVRDNRVDMKVVPLSTFYIHDAVAVVVPSRRELAVYNAAQRNYIMGISNERPVPPKPGKPFPRELAGLFHPDLTGTLQEWRGVLLRELLTYPDVADDVWKGIRSIVTGFEGGHKRSALFPKTAKDALRFFGVG